MIYNEKNETLYGLCPGNKNEKEANRGNNSKFKEAIPLNHFITNNSNKKYDFSMTVLIIYKIKRITRKTRI